MDTFVYLEKGTLQSKSEMEDRVTIGKNVLSSGFHHFQETINGYVAIMDGVGGIAGSVYASSYVANSLATSSFQPNHESIRQEIDRIHLELCANSTTATTLTGLYITESTSTLLHVGNTRLSVLKNGYLVRYTEDQTEGERLLKEGIPRNKIPEQEFCTLNSCMGSRKDMIDFLQIEDFIITSGNKIILTSDGIHDYLKDEDLEYALKNPLSEQCLKEIARMSRIKGSEDDISIIVMEP